MFFTEAGPAGAKAGAKAVEEDVPSRLDLRVGKITQVSQVSTLGWR